MCKSGTDLYGNFQHRALGLGSNHEYLGRPIHLVSIVDLFLPALSVQWLDDTSLGWVIYVCLGTAWMEGSPKNFHTFFLDTEHWGGTYFFSIHPMDKARAVALYIGRFWGHITALCICVPMDHDQKKGYKTFTFQSTAPTF
tara:strand:- start:55 stop:477 length:423 start_codon:yes stop_codon:yes gene_type:complete